MSTPSALEDFKESLPNFFPDYTLATHQMTVRHNHILISYFLDGVELHTAKFYTACLDDSDVVQKFLDQLEEDVDNAFQAHELAEFFATIRTPETKDAPIQYIINTQPILDVMPDIPGVIKRYVYNAPTTAVTVEYVLHDGQQLATIELNEDTVEQVYNGTYNPAEDDQLVATEEALLTGVEEMVATGFLIRKGSHI